MTVAEFIEITGEIEQFYGKKEDDKYNKPQTNFLYEELKNITKARYRQVAREAYRMCKFMPKPSELIAIEKELPREIIKRETEKVDCSRCNGTGLIFYKKNIPDGSKILEYWHIARCNCKNAIDKSKLIPLVDEIGV